MIQFTVLCCLTANRFPFLWVCLLADNLQLTFVFVFRMSVVLHPLKREERKWKRSDWFKRMWLCSSVTACKESGRKERSLKKRQTAQSACIWIGYSYFYSASTKSFLLNKMLLHLKRVEVLLYYTCVHAQNGRNRTWAHPPAILNDSWNSEM